MVTVTFGQSLVLSLGYVEGLVEVTVLDVDGFATFLYPLFRGFVPFPFPAGPLPCPPKVTVRTWGFALTLLLITTTGCCNIMLCSAVVNTACKSLYFFL